MCIFSALTFISIVVIYQNLIFGEFPLCTSEIYFMRNKEKYNLLKKTIYRIIFRILNLPLAMQNVSCFLFEMSNNLYNSNWVLANVGSFFRVLMSAYIKLKLKYMLNPFIIPTVDFHIVEFYYRLHFS